jgi:GxxExxY protein
MNKKLELFSKQILKIVKTVHKELGPGFTESVYQGALAIELRRYKMNYLKEMSFEIFYRNQVAGTGRLDFFINDSRLPNVIIETKSVDKISDSARSQITSYLLSAPRNNDKGLQNTVFGILINWPGAVVDVEKNFVLSNKEPEIEFFLREGKEVKQIAVNE